MNSHLLHTMVQIQDHHKYQLLHFTVFVLACFILSCYIIICFIPQFCIILFCIILFCIILCSFIWCFPLFIKLCFYALSFSMRIYFSSPISITSPFCHPEFDATCKVLQQFLLYHFHWRHLALHCVFLSVFAYSNGWSHSGLTVQYCFSHAFLKKIPWYLSCF